MGSTHSPIRRRTIGGRSLRDFTLWQRLCFLSAWSPPQAWDAPHGENPWTTWTEYLEDFVQVRDELIAHRHPGVTGPLFGDRVIAYRETHGQAALDVATYEDIRGDNEPDPET